MSQGLAERIRRARAVGLGGIARRVRHRLHGGARAAARVEWHARYGATADEASALADALGTSRDRLDDATAALFASPARRFWLDATDDALRERFLARHADDAQRIADQARAARDGDLSWVVPGGVADWHAALPGPARWPLEPSDGIAIGAARPLGDVRLAWEVGRSPHLVRMAQAAWLARDPALARAAAAALEDWIEANPPGLGIGWAHAQEVALRAVAWLWVVELLRPFGVLRGATLQRVAWLLLAHAEYVECHLTDDPTTHNHLVSECFGLAALGLALPTLPGAARFRDRGLRVLWREVEKQVDPEGVHAEGSTHYHAFVLDSLVAALLLADAGGARVPAAARARIGAMADALASWLFPDGTLPAIGDTDCGRAWRLGLDPLDRRDVLAAAAVACERRDLGAIAGDASGAFWLAGGRTIPGAGEAPPTPQARRFAAGGLAVARTGWDADAEVVMFRAGRTSFRPDVLLAHMHADALSLVWRIGAQDVLVDPGTYLYSEGDGWRVALRRTAAHGCVVVDGRDQADVTSARFGLAGERPARWLAFEGSAARLCAGAEHPADGAPRVRRRVVWLAGCGLALCDDVVGTGAHRVESWLQLPEASGAVGGTEAELALAGGAALRVQVFAERAALERIAPDPDAPGPGWRAPRYGRRAPGTALRIDLGTRALPARIVTWLAPARAGVAPARARLVAGESGALLEIDRFRIHFDGETGARSEERA
jgi:hypothetical protein